MSDHSFHKCQDEKCYACSGDLAWCIECRGAEGTLPTECPGEPMGSERAEDVYRGRVDFRGGAWVDLKSDLVKP